MDIEEYKKLARNKIEADTLTQQVRDVIKITKWQKQNMREGFKETFKPLIKSQDSIKKSIDEQQNATIEQLKDNQLALTQGLKQNRAAITEGFDKLDELKKWDLAQLPDFEAIEGPEDEGGEDGEDRQDLPEETPSSSKKEQQIAKFTPDELDKFIINKGTLEILENNGFGKLPSEYLKTDIEELIYDLDKVNKKMETTEELLKNTAKIKQGPDGYRIAEAKAKKRGPNPETKYNIDNFDALSAYATSLNYIKIYREKIGSGMGESPHMIYYNNPHQLLHRLELLGGSIRAGNNGVINEFSQIAHLLNQMKVISNKQLNNLIKTFL